MWFWTKVCWAVAEVCLGMRQHFSSLAMQSSNASFSPPVMQGHSQKWASCNGIGKTDERQLPWISFSWISLQTFKQLVVRSYGLFILPHYPTLEGQGLKALVSLKDKTDRFYNSTENLQRLWLLCSADTLRYISSQQ